MSSGKLSDSWQAVVGAELEKPYMKSLSGFLREEKKQGKVIFPQGRDIFNALNLTAFESVKVVILGQDPYHGEGQAHGLCFSVPQGVPLPPSLKNIFIELRRDLAVENGSHGCLVEWAEQGVLLLNSVLTVENARAASHAGQGWEQFTDTVIAQLSALRENLVFLLWGSYAFKKGVVIDTTKHLVLKSSHPSPLSAYRGFIGNGHFGLANQYLQKHGFAPIAWQLSLAE